MKLKKKLRGWWKDFKVNVECYGFLHALLKELPCYYSVHNFYWAIRHRTINRYNIIKLGAPNYYETDVKLLYAPFVILKDYVENFSHRDWDDTKTRNEYKGIKAIEEKINDLYKSWELDKTTGWEDRESENRYHYQSQIDALREAMRLYIWWTETFPFIEDNNPWHLNFDKMYNTEHPSMGQRFEKTLEDGTEYVYYTDGDVPEELKELRNKYIRESMDYDIRMAEETTNNLISLMKIRNFLFN